MIFPALTALNFVLLITMCAWQWRTARSQEALMLSWSENIPLGFFNRGLGMLVGYFAGIAPAVALAEAFSWGAAAASPVGGFILLLLVSDFVFYWRHRAYHFLFWNWHHWHHDQEEIDVTSTFRFHPAEVVVNTLLFSACVAICGASREQALAVVEVLALQAALSHFNVVVPAANLLDRVFILPRSHARHHCPREPHGNFGFVFSIWDRAFGTWR